MNTLPGLHSGFSCLSGSVILFVFVEVRHVTRSLTWP